MNQQVKEALQKAIGRVRSVDPSYFPVYPGGDKQAIADLAVIAQAYLAEHPADDDETLNHVWFRSASPDGNSWIHGEYASIYLRADNRVELCIGDESAIQEHIKTRGDVRRLCRALGIELKGTP